MGSYCELYVGSYSISSTKGEINPFLLSIFQKDDIQEFERKIDDRIQLLHGAEIEADETEKAVQYVNSANNIKDRLNIMGFTWDKVVSNFQESKEESINQLNEWIADKKFNSSETMNENLKFELGILRESSLEDFLKAMKEIIENDYGYTTSLEELPEDTNPTIKYLLDRGTGLERFPHNYDDRVLLRAMVEVVEPKTLVTYDITELIYGGYYESDLIDVYDEVIGNWTFDYELGDKFLILTEGTTDINIIRDSLNILYPHLAGYYSFMDFGISNASGSASSLVASIKSFVGAGIKNNIIALFDNDTAAESALRGLAKTKLPPNIQIKHYPNLELAENYPTIGPTGITEMDINGLACSIELYLGTDTLINKDGKLIPIQWKGYDSTLKKYQGEIIDKQGVSKKFQKKIKECRQDPDCIDKYDWSGMDAILQTIFKAFNE